jgi:hypothetical protein
MASVENREQPGSPTVEAAPLQPAASGPPGAAKLVPQACPSCGTPANTASPGMSGARTYVYAIGKIEPRFPLISVEKEFA